MTAVISPTFDKAVTALLDHPAIVSMAEDLAEATPDELALLIRNGKPTTLLTDVANARFRELTGEAASHLGAASHAVLALLDANHRSDG
ncbi:MULTISPECIES: hypothetical protein [unclassified Streptomyces]|uniref:hypothetical protein n=1 Tax=unclassified Streptomyces TaxID=2593676 RepID=UPI0033341C45